MRRRAPYSGHLNGLLSGTWYRKCVLRSPVGGAIRVRHRRGRKNHEADTQDDNATKFNSADVSLFRVLHLARPLRRMPPSPGEKSTFPGGNLTMIVRQPSIVIEQAIYSYSFRSPELSQPI